MKITNKSKSSESSNEEMDCQDSPSKGDVPGDRGFRGLLRLGRHDRGRDRNRLLLLALRLIGRVLDGDALGERLSEHGASVVVALGRLGRDATAIV